ncbi:MAG: MFS transporter [Solirubrobacterales bacterium]|nr:MFS transporter [Solirubrobacterales bacterium]
MVARSLALPSSGPLRRIAAGTLVSAIGNGAWYTSWAIFLTRSIGLSPAEVGLGMTIAGACGVAAATPLGWIADRLGAREMFAGLLGLQGVTAGAYALVHGMASFLIVSCLAQVAGGGTGGPRNALVLGLSDGEEQLETLGRLRAISHIGWALGAVVGAAVISVATQPAYLGLLALNGGSYLVYALLVVTVPRVSTPLTRRARGGMRVVRDAPYMSLAGLMGVLALCWAMLSSGLPLWVTLHTHAPRAISAVVVLISSLGIAAFQVRVSRGITAPRAAATGTLLSGCALAASCLLFALSAGGSGLAVIVVMLVAAGLHITGELLFVASSWGLSVPLMPPDAPGEYQGVFATGEAVALMAAPALMTTLIAGWGQPGWLVLAAIFLVPGLAALPVTRWALRTRPSPVG